MIECAIGRKLNHENLHNDAAANEPVASQDSVLTKMDGTGASRTFIELSAVAHTRDNVGLALITVPRVFRNLT